MGLCDKKGFQSKDKRIGGQYSLLINWSRGGGGWLSRVCVASAIGNWSREARSLCGWLVRRWVRTCSWSIPGLNLFTSLWLALIWIVWYCTRSEKHWLTACGPECRAFFTKRSPLKRPWSIDLASSKSKLWPVSTVCIQIREVVYHSRWRIWQWLQAESKCQYFRIQFNRRAQISQIHI